MDVSRHDTDLAALWVDHTRAVGTNQTRLALLLQHVGHADLVLLRDALGDSHDQRHFSLYGLNNGIGSTSRGDVDHRCIRLGLVDSFLHRTKHRQTEVLLASTLRGDTTHEVSTVGERLLTVECGRLTGETLADDRRVLLHVDVLHGVVVAAAQDRRRKRAGTS